MKKKSLLVLFTAAVMSVSSFVSACGSTNHTHKHVYEGDYTVAEADKPTETSTGKAKRYCTSDDGGEQIIELPVLTDSRYTITNNSATATSGGYGTYTITIDGYTITFYAETPAKGSGNQGGNNDPVTGSDETTGVDWTKYWDGGANGGSGSDNFTFTATKNISQVEADGSDDGSTSETAETFSVVFNGNGGASAATQSVVSGSTAFLPTTPERDGYMFVGWTTDANGANAYDFSTAVSRNINLYAQWTPLDGRILSVKGYSESLAVTWQENTPASAHVYYRKSGASEWKTVDQPLIRASGSGVARVDILGLSAGNYEVKIATSAGEEMTLPTTVAVAAYDRSGYAHFNYTEGVGAYDDDGELKEHAAVLYVTEDNKNSLSTVWIDGVEYPLSNVNGHNYLWNNKAGIGWILNNRQYNNGTERATYGISALCYEYGAVTVRILGKVNAENTSDATVSLIEGLTAYDSVENGGSLNDNGRMARITNASNLTIEGVGEDAEIYGWGVHFVANDDTGTYAQYNAGKSFEVRNITFEHYPEDAIGMEGTQGTNGVSGGANAEKNLLISPVERCWIHNNTFLPGYCAAPAESDKAEGDGSCDFKRGQYYTLSYNYFEYCHKTNLIGSADASLTYNVTMHHNWWNNCGSRQPLARRANIHYYNNYISGDPNDSKASLSYVSSLRANCLLFSEANYYDGCKNVTQVKDGVGVSWNNVYYACTDENLYTQLTSRTQTVTNSCAYIAAGIDYSQFYVNASQFYYDEVNQVSDCLLDDAVAARARVMQYAGVNGFGQTETAMNYYTPTSAVQVSGGSDPTVISLPTSKNDTEVNGVLFRGLTGASSGTVKGKGQIITFTLSAPAQFTITATASTADNYPELVGADGTVYASKFSGTLTVVLPAGTFFIGTGNKSKEVTVSAMSFADTEASSQARIAAANQALNNIPSTISIGSTAEIDAARLAYSALLAAEREQIADDLYQRYLQAVTAYSQLQVEYVIARIAYIGTVTGDSYALINAAQSAYSALTATQQSLVTNYATLEAAWATFEQFAVQSVIDRILDLPDMTLVHVGAREDLELLTTWFNAVNNAFAGLTSGEGDNQQDQVIAYNNGLTYRKLTDGIAALSQIEKFFDFRDMLDGVTEETASLSEGGALKTLYLSLTEEQQSALTSAEQSKYDAIIAAYDEEMAKTKVVLFYKGADYASAGVTVSGEYGSNSSYEYTYDGQTYYALKMQSGTTITFEVTEGQTVEIYTSAASKSTYIDGISYKADANGVITLEGLESGTHTITKNDVTNLYYMIIR